MYGHVHPAVCGGGGWGAGPPGPGPLPEYVRHLEQEVARQREQIEAQAEASVRLREENEALRKQNARWRLRWARAEGECEALRAWREDDESMGREAPGAAHPEADSEGGEES